MNRLLWLILLIVWICLGTYCCYTKLCNGGNAAGGDGCSVWKIMDGNRFSHEANTNVKFLKNSDDYISESDVDGALSKVADYLKSNQGRVLTIVGYFASTERNPDSNFTNLGMARADDIKAYLLNAGVPADQLKINGVEYNENCYDGNTLNRGARFMFGS